MIVLIKTKCNKKECLSNIKEDKSLYCDPSFIPTIANQIKADSIECIFYSTDREKELSEIMIKKNKIKSLMNDEPAPKKNIKKSSDNKPKKNKKDRL
jgi:hypothetical protein